MSNVQDNQSEDDGYDEFDFNNSNSQASPQPVGLKSQSVEDQGETESARAVR